jgi:uncharacterized protein
MLAPTEAGSRPRNKQENENRGDSARSAEKNPRSFEVRRKGLFGFFEALARAENPPWFDARGATIGLIIGFGVPIGLQMIILALLRLCFRFNTVVAFAMTWVNNPFSLLPLYYCYYYLGSFILNRPVVMSAEDFQALMRPIFHAGYFWESVHAFLFLGWDILERWTVSAAIFGTVFGFAGYVMAYRIQQKRCKRRARAMGISYEKLLKRLESQVEAQSKSGS